MRKLQATVNFAGQAASTALHRFLPDLNGANIQASVTSDLHRVNDIANGNIIGLANNAVFEVMRVG